MRNDRFDFEDLEVFQRSLDMLERVDRLCVLFKGHRRSLGLQLFDAAHSVLLNLTESTGRTSSSDRAHFLDIANGSARETGAAICAADRLAVGPPALRLEVRRLLIEILSMLTTMSRNLRRRATRHGRYPHRPPLGGSKES